MNVQRYKDTEKSLGTRHKKCQNVEIVYERVPIKINTETHNHEKPTLYTHGFVCDELITKVHVPYKEIYKGDLKGTKHNL